MFALAIHEERHRGAVKGIYDAIATPKSRLWNPLDRYYNTDARKQWGEHFRSFDLRQNALLSEAFRRELFDDFSAYGGFEILEQDRATFEKDRPR